MLKTRRIMNKVSSIILILFLFVSGLSLSQEEIQLKEYALRDASITSKATLNKDYETVLKHTYPSVLILMGGKESAIELIKSTFSAMESQGFIFETTEVLSVSDVVFEQDQYRCYVEGMNQMVMSGMRIKSKSYLLGIYNPAAKFWYFIEAAQLKNTALMPTVLPDFKTSLIIPEDEVTTEKI